jgi:hypothetical protein
VAEYYGDEVYPGENILDEAGLGHSPTIVFPGAGKTMKPGGFDGMGVVMCIVSVCLIDAPFNA